MRSAGPVIACAAIALFAYSASAETLGPMPAPSAAQEPASHPPTQAPQESLPLGAGHATPPHRGPASSAAETTTTGHLLQTILMLGAVIGVILLAGAGFRKIARAKGGLLAQLGPGGRAPAGVLEVLGRYPVSRGSTLVLLKLDRRVLLTCQNVGRRQAGPSMSTLCEITDPEEVASLLMKTREEEGDTLARKFEAMLQSQNAWPTPAIEPAPRESNQAAFPSLAIASEVEPEPTIDALPEPAPRRPTERQLSAALSILRTRVDSLQRQPLARRARA